MYSMLQINWLRYLSLVVHVAYSYIKRPSKMGGYISKEHSAPTITKTLQTEGPGRNVYHTHAHATTWHGKKQVWCVLSTAHTYSWIANQRHTHEKLVCRRTRGTTTLLRPPLESSRQGEFRSDVTILLRHYFESYFI